MDNLTAEQYREYLVKRIEGLTKLIERYENEDCLTPNEFDWYLRTYAALDDVMDRLFCLDTAVDATE